MSGRRFFLLIAAGAVFAALAFLAYRGFQGGAEPEAKRVSADAPAAPAAEPAAVPESVEAKPAEDSPESLSNRVSGRDVPGSGEQAAAVAPPPPLSSPSAERYHDGTHWREAFWAPDEIMIAADRGIDPGTLVPEEAEILDRFDREIVARIEPQNREGFIRLADDLRANPGVRHAQPVFYPSAEALERRSGFERMWLMPQVVAWVSEGKDPQALAERHGGRAGKILSPRRGTWVLESSPGFGALELASALREKEGLVKVIPEFTRRFAHKAVDPNDPLYVDQWHHETTAYCLDTRSAWDITKGAGAMVCIIDDGVQYTHPDLDDHYDGSIDWDFGGDDDDPLPASVSDNHGTSVSGCAAAAGNNSLGVAGVAYEAGLTAFRTYLFNYTTMYNVMTHNNDVIDVKNNSWGPGDGGDGSLSSWPISWVDGVADGVRDGRNGKGVIYVWSAGNGRENNDNVNYDVMSNIRHAITVGSSREDGDIAYYSEPGAALLVSSASYGIYTTDRTGSDGYESGDYYQYFAGTSAAAPVVAGVATLMVSANPDLTYRDVMHIFVRTSNDSSTSGWVTNGGGRTVHHDFGHGIVDAYEAVNAATTWTTVPPLAPAIVKTRSGLGLSIPDNSSTGVTDTVTVSAAESIKVEHVEVVFSATHGRRGDLKVTLISPDGTASVLADQRDQDTGSNYSDWTFMSTFCWDEDAEGMWTLKVEDLRKPRTGTFTDWTLKIYGTPDFKRWTNGTGNGLWNDVDNWTPTGIPDAADYVSFVSDGGSTDTNCTLSGAAGSVRGIWMGDGYSSTLVLESDLSVGDYGIPLYSGTLDIGSGTVTLADGSVFQMSGTLVSSGGTVRAASGNYTFRAGKFSGAELNVSGLTIQDVESTGMLIEMENATVTSFANVAFEGNAGGTGSRHVRLVGASNPAYVIMPGCSFDDSADYGVSAASASASLEVVLEDRGTNGARAGEAHDEDGDADEDGLADGAELAVVSWVYTVREPVISTVAGVEAPWFPVPAFSWNTSAWHSIYVVYRDVDPSGTDRIVALDTDGSPRSYTFDVANADGDIVGIPLWDDDGGNHLLFVVTSLGKVYKLTDSGLAFSLSDSFGGTGVDSVSTAAIMDGTNVYFGGAVSSTPCIFKVSRAGMSLGSYAMSPSRNLVTGLAWQVYPSGTYLFAGSDGGSNANVFRMTAPGLGIDAANGTPTSTLCGAPAVHAGRLHIGDEGGRMHGMAADDFVSTMFEDLPNWPVSSVDSSAFRAKPYYDIGTGDLICGDEGGTLYLVGPTGTADVTSLGKPFSGFASEKIRGVMLCQNGVIAVTGGGGYLAFVNPSGGARLGCYRLTHNETTEDQSGLAYFYDIGNELGGDKLIVSVSDSTRGRLLYVTPPAP